MYDPVYRVALRLQQIVNDLAKANPCEDGRWPGTCIFCGEFGVSKEVINHEQPPLPELHKSDCPWRRAQEYVKETQ